LAHVGQHPLIPQSRQAQHRRGSSLQIVAIGLKESPQGRPRTLIAGRTQQGDNLASGDGIQDRISQRLQQFRDDGVTHPAQEVKGPVMGGLRRAKLPDQGCTCC
jgi:hypothetical protein